MARRRHRRRSREDGEKWDELFDLHPETKKGIWAVVFIAFAIVTALAYAKLSGPAGAFFVRITQFLFGIGAFLLPFILFSIAIVLFRSWGRRTYLASLLGAFLFLASLLGVADIVLEGGQRGGWVGYLVARPFQAIFGFWGALVIIVALGIIGVLITLNIPLPFLWHKKGEEQTSRGEPSLEKQQDASPSEIRIWTDQSSSPQSFTQLWRRVFHKKPAFRTSSLERGEEEGKGQQVEDGLREDDVARAQKTSPRSGEDRDEFVFSQTAAPAPSSYELPPIELIEEDRGIPTSGDIKANVNVIKRTLANFGIEVEMGEVSVGPSVTQYTLKPAEGVKLARIHALQNDLALALAAYPLRIEAPIPGRSLVGIEIPNRTTTLVRLRNLIIQEAFHSSPARLLFALGRDVTGEPLFADLAKMPHLLIAGSTGAGKSVCIHSILTSFLYRSNPSQLQLLVIDPKRVELSVYNGLPHLLHPVIVEGKKALLALKWAIREMEHRYELLSEMHARDILSYNEACAKKKDPAFTRLSYIVVVIDELADLMAAYARDVEAMIVRLAQMSRAVGIHLLISTQRPSIDVITGLIKANITARIAFQMASQVDSRTVLDMAGAEKLLGNGDMLFLAGDASKPKRVQGAYVSEREVKRITMFLKKYSVGEESVSMPDFEQAGREASLFGAEAGPEGDYDDDLYEEALAVVRQARKASASLLQRRLRVGYARAARLLDILEERGVIGPGEGAKPRIVYGVEEEEDEGSSDEENIQSL